MWQLLISLNRAFTKAFEHGVGGGLRKRANESWTYRWKTMAMAMMMVMMTLMLTTAHVSLHPSLRQTRPRPLPMRVGQLNESRKNPMKTGIPNMKINMYITPVCSCERPVSTGAYAVTPL